MEQYINLLIGLLAIAAIIFVLIKRPNRRTLRRWVLARQPMVDRVASLILVFWGGMIWLLMISKRDFSNVIAIVAASVLVCAGAFFLFKRS